MTDNKGWRYTVCIIGAYLSLAILSGCATTPAIDVQIQERLVEVQRPCPASAPDRPAHIGTLPDDARDAARVLAARVLELQGAGGLLDQLYAALAICTAPTP